MKQTESAYQKLRHPFGPIFDESSRVLMLGTFPSPKSREYGIPYGNPHNRFWRVMAQILNEPFPETNEKKIEMLLRHHIALWDVLESCEIKGASDASIKNPRVNDLTEIFAKADIFAIFCTGTKATELYRKLAEPKFQRPCIGLPSTSPANARYKLNDLVEAYDLINQYLDDSQEI